MPRYTRRRLVETGIGLATIGTLAGCLSSGAGSNDSGEGGPKAQSSFFVFGDLASQVAGDTATAETLVPIGQHGHGWEPGPQIQGAILESDLFLYGMEGFQPWADDIVDTIQSDDPEVTLVDASAGIDLRESGHSHDHEGEDDHESEHHHENEHDHDAELGEHELSHACGHMVDDQREPLSAATGEDDAPSFSQTHQPYAVTLESETGYVTFEGDQGTYAFFTDVRETVRTADPGVTHEQHGVESCDGIESYYVVQTETGSVTLELTGGAGTTLTLLAEGVSGDDHHQTETEHETETHEEGHEHETETHEEHDGEADHDHAGGMDPHFWIDPVRAKTAVDNIQQGFAEVDSGNTATYESNAAEYKSKLDDLHGSLESALDGASKDVVFVAGHNAFGYLGARYGFEVKTLTSISPDDQPTPKDIEQAQQLIEEHDLQYVCSDPLESQTAADQLVAETDAEEVLPLTSIPGQTQEWADNDWGYVEIMEKVNLETLKQALDAE